MKISSDTKLVEQTILNLIQNILLKIYETPRKGFSFRLVKIKNNKEIDPITNSNKFDWAYGYYSSPQEVREVAKKTFSMMKS